jgi:hypothetical protein
MFKKLQMQVQTFSAVSKRISCLYMYSIFHNSIEQILLTKAVLVNVVKKFLVRLWKPNIHRHA